MNDNARRALVDAQQKYEADSKAAEQARQETFRRAHKEQGLSYSDIGQVVGLPKTTVSEIVKGRK